jgi:VHL beta domain
MNPKWQRYGLLPFIIALLITIFFRGKLAFLQSNSELPANFICLTVMNAAYIAVAGGFTYVISKALKLRSKNTSRLWWSLALLPFAFFFAINTLVSVIQMNHKRFGPQAVFNGWDDEDGMPCNQASGRRSPASTGRTAILFSNQSRFKVRVNWLDTSGSQRFYKELGPGEKYEQVSGVGQLWSVSDTAGKCLAVYAAKANSALNQALVNDAGL